jgi:hypothetical protein
VKNIVRSTLLIARNCCRLLGTFSMRPRLLSGRVPVHYQKNFYASLAERFLTSTRLIQPRFPLPAQKFSIPQPAFPPALIEYQH